MIENHLSIEIEKFANNVKNALRSSAQPDASTIRGRETRWSLIKDKRFNN